MSDISKKGNPIELSESNNNKKEEGTVIPSAQKEGEYFMSTLTTKGNNKIATVQNLLDKLQPQLMKALPKHLSPERMTRIALTELRKIPQLAECDPTSFCGSIMMCAQLGLEPGGALGHIYLIPYGKQVQVILGYRGMIELARRSGQIVSLSAHEVYENDTFEFSYGLEEKLRHVPNMKERGAMIAVYAVAHLVGGGHQIEVMSKEDVDKIRARSKTSGKGPWVSDYEEMAKKTVLRKLFKYLPVSIEIQRAASMDEQSEIGVISAKDEIDFDYEIDKETGEIVEPKEINQADALAEKIK